MSPAERMATKILPVELPGDGLGLFLKLEVVCLELVALALEVLAVLLGRPQRLLLRQEEVARKAVLHVDDVAHLAEAADALKQNDLHGDTPSFSMFECQDFGGALLEAGGLRMGQTASARPRRARPSEASVFTTKRVR